MKVTEGMESAPRNFEFVENRRQCLTHDILRDEEMPTAIQKEPFVF